MSSIASASPRPEALLCTSVDPWSEPRGGATAFARQFVESFGPSLGVVSPSEETLPCGVWIDRSVDGQRIKFFNLGTKPIRPACRKPLIPERVSAAVMAARYMRRVRLLGVRNAFFDCPELLIPAARFEWNSVCYYFHGLNNPVSNSRYKALRLLGGLFDDLMCAALRGIRPDLLIAAADEQTVGDFSSRMSGRLPDVPILSFPTRVDTALFYPENKFHARRTLGWTSERTILVSLGRLCWIKGWELLLQALAELRSRGSSAMLAFVGDGEERRSIHEMAVSLGIAADVYIAGFVPHETVRACINAADLCVVGSYEEGWSVAMLEELACGKAIVSTPVSGANRMVQPGKNGFIVQERHPVAYADAIEAALRLTAADAVSLEIAHHFSTETLAQDLAALWRPLASHAARRSVLVAGNP